MNKDTKGEQCTILWNIHDINTSHRYPKLVTTIIDLIISVYGRESPLKFTCGKVHENLEMTIDFYEKGKIKFTMYDYIANMLEDLPEDKKEVEAATPSGDHLFRTNKDKPEKLSEE